MFNLDRFSTRAPIGIFLATCFFMAGSIVGASVAQAYSPGDLDQSFGAGTGYVHTEIGSFFEFTQDVVVQPDGKIVTVGASDNGMSYDIVLMRYNSDGSLDTSFSGDGITVFDNGGGDDFGLAVALQPDGKILVTGRTTETITMELIVLRFHSDGSLDSSFDGDTGTGNGVVTITVGSVAFGNSIALQPDGKIVVAGSRAVSNSYDFLVVRFHSDGSLDTSFNGDGIVTTDIAGSDDLSNSMLLQSDGKIVLVGDSHSGNNSDFSIARYHTDGSLDTSFSGNGTAMVDASGNNDSAFGVAVQADNKIVVAGHSENGPNFELDFLVMRFNPDGSLDSSFDGDSGTGNGIVTTSVESGNDQALAVLLQADGKILVAGSSSISFANRNIAVVRFNSDGSLDMSFSGDGKVITDVASGEDAANAVVLQPDGRAIVAGYSRQSINSSNYTFFLARYHLNQLPTTTVISPESTRLVQAPTEVFYRAGNKEVLVTWSWVDGAASYVVTNTSGVSQCTSTVLSCTVSGLRNGRAYNYLVYSVNADGVRSMTGTQLSVRPGFQIKKTSVKAKKKIRIASIASTPSQGVMTWKFTSGKCRFEGIRLVAPNKSGSCKIRLTVKAKGSYPAMSTTVRLIITK